MKKFFSFFAALLFAGSMMADNGLVYTLQYANADGAGNSYAATYDVTIDGIEWNVPGNAQMDPARIGGKNLDGVDRVLYSKTPLNAKVSKIEIEHGTATDITVNSLTVIVASDAEFNDVLSTLNPEFEAEATIAVECPENVVWENAYYKIVYNLTVAGNSNKFVQFKSAKFYGEAGEVPPVEPEQEYYLVGSKIGWEAKADYKLAKNAGVEGEWFIDVTVEEGEGLKVLGIKGEDKTWYKDGMGTEYVVKAEEAGDVTVYFRPEGNDDWSYTYLYIYKEVLPTNLGEKTIAEFLELKNEKDTCILTGVVDSIKNTTYGNLYLSDETAQVYVYGLLTPEGEAKKFSTLDVEVGDTLTILARYSEYKGNPQVQNAIFVEVKKAVVVPVELTFTFKLENNILTITPSNDDPWAGMAIPESVLAEDFGGDIVAFANVVADMVEATPGEKRLNIAGLDPEEFTPGNYVFVAWGFVEGAVTTVASYKFVIDETPVEPEQEYFLVGSELGWEAKEENKLAQNPESEGEWFIDVTVKEGEGLKVLGVKGEDQTWYKDGMGTEYVVKAEEAGDVTVYFRPEGNEAWEYNFFILVKKEAPVVDTLTCAAAAEAAAAGSKDEVYVKGYVTEIATAWNAQNKNMTFWMADEKNGGKVFEAYKCAIENEEDVVRVGDLVLAHGTLDYYAKNQVPELAAGCTVEIIERGEVIEPKNLGEKTIAEFLELKNTVDTCILTGIVSNIKNTEYGNFDLTDETATVYVYGLLTPEGEAKQFASLNVAEGDTLTILAIYNEYQGNPQVKNAIFVEVKKAEKPEPEIIPLDFSEGDGYVRTQDFEEYGAVDLVLYNIPVEGQAFVGDGDYLVLDIYPEETNDITGTYSIEEETLDDYYSYLLRINGNDTTQIGFSAGEVAVEVKAVSVEQSIAQIAVEARLLGADENIYVVSVELVVYYEFIEEQGVEDVTIDPKAIKRIEMGQVIIEKNNAQYTVTGQRVR